jgi:hypothetical protein
MKLKVNKVPKDCNAFLADYVYNPQRLCRRMVLNSNVSTITESPCWVMQGSIPCDICQRRNDTPAMSTRYGCLTQFTLCSVPVPSLIERNICDSAADSRPEKNNMSSCTGQPATFIRPQSLLRRYVLRLLDRSSTVYKLEKKSLYQNVQMKVAPRSSKTGTGTASFTSSSSVPQQSQQFTEPGSLSNNIHTTASNENR